VCFNLLILLYIFLWKFLELNLLLECAHLFLYLLLQFLFICYVLDLHWLNSISLISHNRLFMLSNWINFGKSSNLLLFSLLLNGFFFLHDTLHRLVCLSDGCIQYVILFELHILFKLLFVSLNCDWSWLSFWYDLTNMIFIFPVSFWLLTDQSLQVTFTRIHYFQLLLDLLMVL